MNKNISRVVLVFVGALMMIQAVEAQPFLTNNLIVYYPLNGNANDYFGNHNGVAQNVTVTTNQFGITNSAYHFNGNNSAIVLPNDTINNLSQGSMAVWAKLDSNSRGTIFVKQHSGANTEGSWLVGLQGYGGGINSANPGQICYEAQNSSPQVLSITNLLANVWYYLTVTFSTTNCVLYVNGNYAGSAAGNFSLPDDPSPTEVSLGFWHDISADLQGSLDSFMIFNKSLASNEVAQLYATESALPIQIIQDLTNTSVVYGSNTMLSVVANGPAPLNYQWYFVPANGSGQAGAYAQTTNNFVYGAVVTNGGFGYGNIPNVSFVGGSGTGAAGYATVSNSMVTGIVVTSAGTGYTIPPAVVIGPPNGFLNGQTNNTLAITNANGNNLGSYFVVISSTRSSVASQTVSLTLLYPPSITTNPVGFVANYKASGTLNVSASGTAPLIYQWILNGTNVTGATNSLYTINSLTLSNAGSYTVTVSNAYGLAVSPPVTVAIAPSLTAPFMGAIGLWGQDTVLDVGAVGSGMLNYQWYFNGQPITGATSSAYALDNIQFTNAGFYSVVISSTYGSVSNIAYQVVVNPADTAIGTCPIIYLTGTAGYTYTIQESTDLADTNAWTTLTNIMLQSSSTIWADTATDTTKPGNPKKFYRVIPGQ